jgi:hypothetical protein
MHYGNGSHISFWELSPRHKGFSLGTTWLSGIFLLGGNGISIEEMQSMLSWLEHRNALSH